MLKTPNRKIFTIAKKRYLNKTYFLKEGSEFTITAIKTAPVVAYGEYHYKILCKRRYYGFFYYDQAIRKKIVWEFKQYFNLNVFFALK